MDVAQPSIDKGKYPMENKRIHPETGVLLVRSFRKLTLKYRSLSMVVDMPGWYPEGDATPEQGLHDQTDMRVSDVAIEEMKAIEMRRPS